MRSNHLESALVAAFVGSFYLSSQFFIEEGIIFQGIFNFFRIPIEVDKTVSSIILSFVNLIAVAVYYRFFISRSSIIAYRLNKNLFLKEIRGTVRYHKDHLNALDSGKGKTPRASSVSQGAYKHIWIDSILSDVRNAFELLFSHKEIRTSVFIITKIDEKLHASLAQRVTFEEHQPKSVIFPIDSSEGGYVGNCILFNNYLNGTSRKSWPSSVVDRCVYSEHKRSNRRLSFLALPLRDGEGKCIGALMIDSEHKGDFSIDDDHINDICENMEIILRMISIHIIQGRYRIESMDW